MFSTVLRHPLDLNTSAPVVFVQYLLAIAIVAGIKSYDRGYDRLPVRLKWPNDIYALDASKLSPGEKPPLTAADAPLSDAQRARYAKIGGILISTSYTPSTPFYTLVCGAGINVANAAPTTSLNALAAHYGLPPLAPEKLLAAILARFEVLYDRFCRLGFAGEIKRQYEVDWLHAGQTVRLDPEVNAGMEGGYVPGAGYGPRVEGEKCRVRGISEDWGLLVVDELVGEDGRERPSGRAFELQSDSNSFDFFKGLLKKKV